MCQCVRAAPGLSFSHGWAATANGSGALETLSPAGDGDSRSPGATNGALLRLKRSAKLSRRAEPADRPAGRWERAQRRRWSAGALGLASLPPAVAQAGGADSDADSDGHSIFRR